jgi:hypothetical protein
MLRWVVWVTWSTALLIVGVTWAPAAVRPGLAPSAAATRWPSLARPRLSCLSQTRHRSTYPSVPTMTVDAPATRVECADLNLRHNQVYSAVV